PAASGRSRHPAGTGWPGTGHKAGQPDRPPAAGSGRGRARRGARRHRPARGAAAQCATHRPGAVAWLAIAPLLASLVLRPPRTALLAAWTVLLGLGLALHRPLPGRRVPF